MTDKQGTGSVPLTTEKGDATPLVARQACKAQRHGVGWVAGSFLFCPCHLPVTLGILAFLLGGTTVGALLRHNLLLAGTVLTLVWALGTWRGVRQLRVARTCAVKPARA